VTTRDLGAAERVVAEAMEAGALGVEERDREDDIALLLYAPSDGAEAVVRALRERCGPTVRVSGPFRVPETDWSEAWKAGLETIVVSPRLQVRPSFVPASPGFQGAELVIDPGQAFGTGGHASTLLALEWIGAEAGRLKDAARVLDVGTGTGILALAALRLGAGHAVAFDLDPLAAVTARRNASANGLGEEFDVFVGSVEALSVAPFDLVLANLLSSELLPVAPVIAGWTAPGGRAVVSGLLEGESVEVTRRLEAAGLRRLGLRLRDDTSGECWASLLMTR
jgi:ribosomal protein L11 methyltransferase